MKKNGAKIILQLELEYHLSFRKALKQIHL